MDNQQAKIETNVSFKQLTTSIYSYFINAYKAARFDALIDNIAFFYISPLDVINFPQLKAYKTLIVFPVSDRELNLQIIN